MLCRKTVAAGGGYMGLQLTDDETTILLSAADHLSTFALSTGQFTMRYNYSDFKATCDTGTPVALSSSDLS